MTDPEHRERLNRQQNERRRERYATDPEYRERMKAEQRKYCLEHPDYIRRQIERFNARMAEDPELRARVNAYKAEWDREKYATDPEWRTKRNGRRHKRRAAGELWPGVTELLMEAQRGRCANPKCKVRLTRGNTHLDHVVAIANGGTNEIQNLQLLCQRCNTKKGAKPFGELIAAS